MLHIKTCKIIFICKALKRSGKSNLLTQGPVSHIWLLRQEKGPSGSEACGHLDKAWGDRRCESTTSFFCNYFLLRLTHHSAPPRGGWGPSVETSCQCLCFPPPADATPDWFSELGPPPAAHLHTATCRTAGPQWRRCPWGLHGHWSHWRKKFEEKTKHLKYL